MTGLEFPSRPAPRPRGRAARAWTAVLGAWRKAEQFHDTYFASRLRHVVRREAQSQHDTLRALLLLDSLGVDNPVAYETLDLIPYYLADLHEWHTRMGRTEYGGPQGCC